MKKFINVLLFAVVMVAASSCVSETPVVEEPTLEGVAEVVLRLRAPENFQGTRSTVMTHDDENAIDDVFVFVFQNDQLILIREGTDINVDPINPPAGGISADGTFSVTLPAGITARLMVLANARSILEAAGQTSVSGFGVRTSYAQVIAAIEGSVGGRMFEVNKRIPMWGQEPSALPIEPGTSRPAVRLHRAIARIDVGVGAFSEDTQTWAGLDNFELTNVYVMRPNNRFALIPSGGALPTPITGNPTIPEEATVLPVSRTFAWEPDAGVVTRRIYVPEADIKNPDPDNIIPAPRPGDGNHLSRMAVVVGGYFAGSTTATYYRIDFATGPRDNRQLVNVLRNHLYRISIAAVTGPGEATPEEAYRSASINMNVEVNEWNELELPEIFVDGVRWIRLQNSFNENLSRQAVLYRPAGSTDEIQFQTNIPPKEWIMEIDPDGDEIALTDEDKERDVLKIIENDLFRIELIQDSSSTVVENGQNITTYHGRFRFIALVDENDAPSVLTVRSGRIHFPINIEQRGDAPDDWWDGGNQNEEIGRPRP